MRAGTEPTRPRGRGRPSTPSPPSPTRSSRWIPRLSRRSGSSSSPSSGSGYLVLEGFDFGVGMLLPVLGRDDAERRAIISTDRPGLGRQRGVAAHRGRRHVRRLPGVVRDPLLGLLPGPLPDPGRADRPRRRLRVPRQARHAPAGARPGTRRSSSAASSPPCCGASPSRTWCAASPLDADHEYVGLVLRPAQPLRAARRRRDARCSAPRTARSSSRCAPSGDLRERARALAAAARRAASSSSARPSSRGRSAARRRDDDLNALAVVAAVGTAVAVIVAAVMVAAPARRDRVRRDGRRRSACWSRPSSRASGRTS